MLLWVVNRRMKSDTTLLIQRVPFRPHFWPIRPLLTSDLPYLNQTSIYIFFREIVSWLTKAIANLKNIEENISLRFFWYLRVWSVPFGVWFVLIFLKYYIMRMKPIILYKNDSARILSILSFPNWYYVIKWFAFLKTT